MVILIVDLHIIICSNTAAGTTEHRVRLLSCVYLLYIFNKLVLNFLLCREMNKVVTQVSTIFLLIVQLLWMCRHSTGSWPVYPVYQV